VSIRLGRSQVWVFSSTMARLPENVTKPATYDKIL